jgi:hypothetical protein
MKIHPIVGAEILQRVHFPYPVVPIVRSHHERWDGTGYPDGLKGEEIPIGARILSAVDCLDALATDRQYRKALPLDDAMQWLVDQAGRAFDPKVIGLLKTIYTELEAIVRLQSHLPDRHKLSIDLKVERGDAPANGFEDGKAAEAANQAAFLSSIAAARQEAQALFELTQDLGNSLNLRETLSVLDSRLKRLIPYDAMAVYVVKGDRLAPAYVNGEDYRLFSSLEIPMGDGLSGWVAENRKPILNGNPSVESGYLHEGMRLSNLRSGLVLPLERAEQAGRGAGAVPHRTRRLYQRPPADAARDQFQDVAGHRKRAQIPAGRKLGDNGLPHQPAERPFPLPPARQRTGAV